ncbi:MAG: GntR family transcriptional regulator [Syntrophaceae bacterium]|nr:GntR family transcriptional regulator [Syntrophaceae bacterium]
MKVTMANDSTPSRNRKDKGVFFEAPYSFSDQVYERLKEKILLGEIDPGERLMQNQVAESLSASRTPVREAFRRLEKDGLVERVPQGGVRVTRIDPDTIQDVFGIRKVLEAYAVELACDRITGEEISTLKRLMSQARETLKSPELDLEAKLKKLFELNSQFHDTIYRASGNAFLLGIINNLRNIVRRMRYLGLRADSTWDQVWDEHSRLIECLERKDRESAAGLIQEHLVNAASYVEAELKSKGTRASEENPGSAPEVFQNGAG